MKPGRRGVLAGGAGAVAMALGWRSPASAAPDIAALALATPLDRLIPAEPAHLAADETERLWAINAAVVRRWRMAPLPQDAFTQFLDLKTASAPSFAGEYRNALALLGPATELDAFVARAASAAAPLRLARVRDYVVSEFAAFNLMNGGFRAFGLRKVQGYMTGPMGYTRAGAVSASIQT